MKNIQDNFVPYEIALELKELGFESMCFGFYRSSEDILPTTELITRISSIQTMNKVGLRIEVLAPLYQQAFDFFREKYNLDSEIGKYWHYSLTEDEERNRKTFYRYTISNFKLSRKDYLIHLSMDRPYQKYKDAELACLKQLILICK
jgi:hypothetical protein